MIAFDLKCEKGHSFEGWFESSHAFDTQKGKGLVTCPVCNSASVSKALSRFGIVKSNGTAKGVAIDPQAVVDNISKKIYDFVEKNFDDVGADFTKEALKIHYGVSEPRNIKGVSSKEEEKLLREEGVDFIKVPIPAEKNDTDV
ncbi:MAG: DUF1178 family protein [Deltaproteobacteria bacterium]|nr:MAG: DUF1178 family protein [Deltaproteobacteria bacterium]